jgi:predicted Rossmann-fold nucleotide-binding protein
MSRRTIVGIMGGSVADERTMENARNMGRLIAENGWVLLSGGRPHG